MTLDSKDYVDILRQLPPPTLAQTERFARFVSSAHSWYKHLPIYPEVPFVFYLDPGAGKNRVHTRSGETALVEITDESSRFHYTWQKTKDYRRRFGCWSYHADYGTSFQFAGEDGVVNTAGAGLRVLTDSGDWVDVPQELVAAGTSHVSALIHPGPNFFIWARDPERFGLSKIPDPEEMESPATVSDVVRRLESLLQQVRRTHPRLAEVGQLIPKQVLEVIQRPLAERPEEMWLWPSADGGWDWPDTDWLDRLRASGIESKLISAVVKYVEVERLRTLSAEQSRDRAHPSTEEPAGTMHRIMEWIMEERGRQLLGMTDAMLRFVAGVYPERAIP